MRLHKIAAVLLLGVMSAGMTHAADKAPTDDNMIGLTTPNGKLVYDFINMWWNEKKGVEAWEKYVSHDNYLNHAVYSAKRGVKVSFEDEKNAEGNMAAKSTVRFDIKQLVAQGSLVFAHVHAVKTSGPGNEVVMIFRVRDGKIIDHWDIHEELKEDSMVFDDLVR